MSLRRIMQTLLFAEIFVSTVIWDFCTAFLAPCTSKSVCLPFLQPFLFGFGICTLYLLQLLHFVFSLSSFPLSIMCFGRQISFFVFSQVNLIKLYSPYQIGKLLFIWNYPTWKVVKFNDFSRWVILIFY